MFLARKVSGSLFVAKAPSRPDEVSNIYVFGRKVSDLSIDSIFCDIPKRKILLTALIGSSSRFLCDRKKI